MESKRRGAVSWRGAVALKIDRYCILQLARAIAAMQARDRERLALELSRLDREVGPVQVATKETT